jgi:peptidoglycan/LPS O-acetylase OafA/YrhL
MWLYEITEPLYCLILIAFYLRLSAEWGEPHGFFTRYLEKIGEESFGIYLIHLFFLVIFAASLTRAGLGYDTLLFYPTLVFLTLISNYWGVRGLYRLPFSAIVIGKPRKKEESKPPQTARIPVAR